MWQFADCLKSSVCFLLYAPEELASTQYLNENEAAYVATTKEQLIYTVDKLLHDKKFREGKIKNALMLALKNHDAKKNGEFVAKLITKVTNEGITN